MKGIALHIWGANEEFWYIYKDYRIKYMRYKYWTTYTYGTNEEHWTTYEILMNGIGLIICDTNEDYLTRYMRRQWRVINNIYVLLMISIGLHIYGTYEVYQTTYKR